MEDKAAGHARGEREVRGPPNRGHGHGEKGPLKRYYVYMLYKEIFLGGGESSKSFTLIVTCNHLSLYCVSTPSLLRL